jgi:hypothetical protein
MEEEVESTLQQAADSRLKRLHAEWVRTVNDFKARLVLNHSLSPRSTRP